MQLISLQIVVNNRTAPDVLNGTHTTLIRRFFLVEEPFDRMSFIVLKLFFAVAAIWAMIAHRAA